MAAIADDDRDSKRGIFEHLLMSEALFGERREVFAEVLSDLGPLFLLDFLERVGSAVSSR